MKLTKLLLLSLLTLFMISCGGDDEEVESFDYSVTIMSPNVETQALAGEVVHVHVNFDEADLKTVHNVSVTVADMDGNEMYSYSEHVHEESGHHEHHVDVTLDVAQGTELILTASVWKHEEETDGHGEGEGHGGEDGESHDKMVTGTFNFIAG